MLEGWKLLPKDLLCLVDILSPNETDLARLTGMPTETFEDISKAARKCHEMGVKQLLVKLGEKGSALFVEGEEPIRQPIIPAAKVLDTTGAAYTFMAAYALSCVGKDQKGSFEVCQYEHSILAVYQYIFPSFLTNFLSSLVHLVVSFDSAAAAASLCVQVKGAIPSMPKRYAVIELLESL